MPEHSPIINVEVFPGGNQSWTAVMGANAVRLPTPYGEMSLLTRYFCLDVWWNVGKSHKPSTSEGLISVRLHYTEIDILLNDELSFNFCDLCCYTSIHLYF